MAVAIRSVSSAAFTSSFNLDIPKPSGLAVGDYMVAHISGNALPSVTVPTGFSAITTVSNTTTSGFYGKFADSSDVAASVFTFSNGGGGALAGGIVAITGANTTSPSSVFATDTGSSTSASFAITVTPNNDSSLLLFGVGAYVNVASTITSSGYAVVTSNPTWTERYDQAVSAGNSFQMALATATRTQITATGNGSVTFSGGSLFTGAMIVIRPQLNTTITESVATTDTIIKSLNKTITEIVSMIETLSSFKSRLWRKTNKPSTTWRKYDK